MIPIMELIVSETLQTYSTQGFLSQTAIKFINWLKYVPAVLAAKEACKFGAEWPRLLMTRTFRHILSLVSSTTYYDQYQEHILQESTRLIMERPSTPPLNTSLRTNVASPPTPEVTRKIVCRI